MKLLLYPNDNLKKYCEEVKEFNEELHNILDSMKEVMIKHNGLGLAANQVGILKRIFIMKDSKGKVWEFINPVILFKHDVQYLNEGCLSFPGIIVQINRAKQVSVKAFNRNGEEFSVGCTGLDAIYIQHEMEHLEGIFFTNNLSREERRRLLKGRK